MGKMRLFAMFVALTALFLSLRAQAWDDQRKGFLLGFGIGPGFTSFTQTLEAGGLSAESPREDKMAVMTDFKIGYAPDNSWALYYNSKVSWFGMKNVFSNNVTVANGLGAVAVSYWLKPGAPSPFLATGFGYSTWSLPFEDERPDTWMGMGLFAGGGWEFSKHASLEAYLCWGKPEDQEFGIEVSADALSLMITINYLGY